LDLLGAKKSAKQTVFPRDHRNSVARSTRGFRMRKLGLLCVLFILRCVSAGAESYKGLVTLPIDLYTVEGIRLAKGKYETEIKVDKNRFILSFYSEGKTIAVIGGEEVQGDLFTLPATLPLAGTHYLRSSADPLQTAQERQFSKPGLPQYAEETRDWKAAIRVYESPTGSVFFVFQLRGQGVAHRRADARLTSQEIRR